MALGDKREANRVPISRIRDCVYSRRLPRNSRLLSNIRSAANPSIATPLQPMKTNPRDRKGKFLSTLQLSDPLVRHFRALQDELTNSRAKIHSLYSDMARLTDEARSANVHRESESAIKRQLLTEMLLLLNSWWFRFTCPRLARRLRLALPYRKTEAQNPWPGLPALAGGSAVSSASDAGPFNPSV